MESSPAEKQMYTTNGKGFVSDIQGNIFKVRNVPYKPYPNQKASKFKILPFKQETQEPKTSIVWSNQVPGKKKQIFAINFPSNSLMQLKRKYQNLKEECQAQKLSHLKVQKCVMFLQKLNQREQQLAKCSKQQARLLEEKNKLQIRRNDIKKRIQQIRQRNEFLRQEQQQRNEEIRLINMENLRNLIISMRYQNGIDIDPDQMTYEELLELQEKMGKVSRGLTEQQFQALIRKKANGEQDVCSICYCNITKDEEIILLQCAHQFHVDCLNQWFSKEKVCPLCKREVIRETQKSLESTQ